ncbi:MAG: hypothetical protein WAT92_19965 [Saprospiraceae bacterium]
MLLKGVNVGKLKKMLSLGTFLWGITKQLLVFGKYLNSDIDQEHTHFEESYHHFNSSEEKGRKEILSIPLKGICAKGSFLNDVYHLNQRE